MYTVTIARRAQDAIGRLPDTDAARVRAAIAALADDPRPPGCKKLVGEEPVLWRIRVGSYRVVYAIDDGAKTVTVLKVGHRRQVYR